MRQDSPTQIPANYIAAIYPFLPQSRRYLDFLKLLILIINKLFNTLFFPILTYYGEVWGGGGIYDKCDSNWEKDSIAKTHMYREMKAW